ncbi:transketolase [Kitasatospora sp. NPDC001603]|uniref:transketolase n=1 Tax=Kitasatospora sp. NPDC001603 TaxID=3154388 RepID=UPI00332FB982
MNEKHPAHPVSVPLDPWRVLLIKEKANLSRREAPRPTGDSTAPPFSSSEILATLYYGVLRIRPAEPEWPDRDRFVFGGRATAAALMPLLTDRGFRPPSSPDQDPGPGAGFGGLHDPTRVPGVDFGSGSAGAALPIGVGMATAACLAGRQYRTFVLLDEKERQAEHVWEAALVAGRHALGNLIAIVGHHDQGPDGRFVDTGPTSHFADKWTSLGWDVFHVDGHNVTALLLLLRALRVTDRSAPAVVLARTHGGEWLPPDRQSLRRLSEAAPALGDALTDSHQESSERLTHSRLTGP